MPRPPLAVFGASGIETLEGAGTVGLGAFAGVIALVGTPDDLGRALALAAFALLCGAAMIFVGIGLLRRRRWSRAPAIVTQVLTGLIGLSMIQSGQPTIGVPFVVLAVLALVLLLAPATGRALSQNSLSSQLGGEDGGGRAMITNKISGSSVVSVGGPLPDDLPGCTWYALYARYTRRSSRPSRPPAGWWLG